MSEKQISLRRATLLILVLTLFCVSCDQVTKHVATSKLVGKDPIVLLAGTLRIQYAENEGAFLGLGSRMSPALRFWVFTVGSSVLLLWVLIILMKQRGDGWLRVGALALIAGGGVGNLVDRARQGFVVDFLNVGVGSLRTGIFNVADLAITCGVVVLMLEYFGARKSEVEPAPSGDP
jgi:signal peptidase II